MISKTRAVVGGQVLRGRSELILALPEPAYVDIEVALSMLHAAESAVAVRAWRRAWSPARSALSVTQRTFLPEADEPWAETWRLRLADVRLRALEAYAKTCLELGGAELPGAERATRELVDVAPLRESGHLLLMRALAASGNVAEALAAYERLRILLREELGVDPSEAVQNEYRPPPRVAARSAFRQCCAKAATTMPANADLHDNNKQSHQQPVTRSMILPESEARSSLQIRSAV